MLKEAYQRSVNEVHAKHILIRFNETDSTEAYNDIVEIRKKAVAEGFEKVSSELLAKNKKGKALSYNGRALHVEDLGYFTAFKMVYAFENEAFSTPVGGISKAFKSQFGYHIVYVVDKRKSKGQREVAHIMVNNDKEDAANRIQEIYKKLSQGETFETLAKQFSEDKSSASSGGKLAAFSAGDLRSEEFEKQAFSLEKSGDYSKPFKSEFGWHIVKLLKKIEVLSFAEMKPQLENKIKRDSRSKLIRSSRINMLKKKYSISNVEKDLAYFVSILNAEYYKSHWHLPKDFTKEKSFLKIENKQFTYQDFGMFIVKSQKRAKNYPSFKALVQEKYRQFLETNLIKYQEDNLENDNQEYAQILGEYRDGLLLFDLMEN
ncbi:MAG: peptidylprolyl isomerase, partial [Oceanihabitans sp.]